MITKRDLDDYEHRIKRFVDEDHEEDLDNLIYGLVKERDVYREVAWKEHFVQTRMDEEWKIRSYAVVDAEAKRILEGKK